MAGDLIGFELLKPTEFRVFDKLADRFKAPQIRDAVESFSHLFAVA